MIDILKNVIRYQIEQVVPNVKKYVNNGTSFQNGTNLIDRQET